MENAAQSINELGDEVACGNFRDRRLTERLRRIVTGLAKEPALSLPRALDEAGLEGAYRFLSNHRVTPAEILSSHYEATRRRSEAEPTVLVAHDTTMFSYRYDGERQGLGRAQPRNDTSNQAFYAHFSLALAADGTRRPLGVAGYKTWVRAKEGTGTEYQRWEDQLRASSLQLNGLKNVIHLADREADDYEMFCALERDGHRFVMRCLHNRLLEDSEDKRKLHDVFDNVVATAEREVPLSRRKPKHEPAKTRHIPLVLHESQICQLEARQSNSSGRAFRVSTRE